MPKLNPLRATLITACLTIFVFSCEHTPKIRVVDIENHQLRTQDSVEQDSMQMPVKRKDRRRMKSMRELKESSRAPSKN